MMTTDATADQPADTNEAYRPASPWWGSMLCPVAVVVGRMDQSGHDLDSQDEV